MKRLFLFFLLLTAATAGIAQTGGTVSTVKLLPLITHGGTPGAGCYIQDKKDRVYCQLTADEVYFNINKLDEIYQPINKEKMLKGYDYGFKNAVYSIFIKEIPLKKEGCLTNAKYKIVVKYKGKWYKQSLIGFCGC